MAVGVFDFNRQLGKCFAKSRDEHHRVKTKTIAADGFAGNFTDHPAHRHQRLWVLRGAHRHKGADQRRAALCTLWNALHLLQQRTDVVVVALWRALAKAFSRKVQNGSSASPTPKADCGTSSICRGASITCSSASLPLLPDASTIFIIFRL